MDELFEGTLFSYDEPEDQEAELRGLMAYSGSGKLYVACDDGSIKAADVRQQLLSGAWAERGTKADGAPPLRLRTLTASPPLELTAAHFALNRSGTYAAVAGSALEDPEISRVVVVDLTNCRPAPPAPTSPARGGAAAGGRGGAAPTGAHAVHDVCEAVVLDAELFASRPGLRVLQIEWHPDSDSHLAVLTSDNVWRLYNTQRADLAEQTFELQLRGRRGLGLGGGGSSSNGRAVAAFAFGPPEGWQRFAVYFLTADGELWSLCPVVPFGCRYAASLIDQVAESSSASLDAAANAEAWLQRAFTQLSTPQDPAFASGAGGGL
jgi:nuclear pore complex protein Nup88